SNISNIRHVRDKLAEELPGKPAETEPPEKQHWMRKLDDVLAGAIDRHYDGGTEAKHRDQYDKARPVFDEMRKDNPALTWQAFGEDAVHADRSLFLDPVTHAGRIAAASGLPVTPLQQEVVNLQAERQANTQYYENLVRQMESAGELPSL